jgi:hypothetical protein
MDVFKEALHELDFQHTHHDVYQGPQIESVATWDTTWSAHVDQRILPEDVIAEIGLWIIRTASLGGFRTLPIGILEIQCDLPSPYHNGQWLGEAPSVAQLTAILEDGVGMLEHLDVPDRDHVPDQWDASFIHTIARL